MLSACLYVYADKFTACIQNVHLPNTRTNCESVCRTFEAALNKMSSTHPLTSGVCDSKHACIREADILNTCCKFISAQTYEQADNIPGRHLLKLNAIAPY